MKSRAQNPAGFGGYKNMECSHLTTRLNFKASRVVLILLGIGSHEDHLGALDPTNTLQKSMHLPTSLKKHSLTAAQRQQIVAHVQCVPHLITSLEEYQVRRPVPPAASRPIPHVVAPDKGYMCLT